MDPDGLMEMSKGMKSSVSGWLTLAAYINSEGDDLSNTIPSRMAVFMYCGSTYLEKEALVKVFLKNTSPEAFFMVREIMLSIYFWPISSSTISRESEGCRTIRLEKEEPCQAIVRFWVVGSDRLGVEDGLTGLGFSISTVSGSGAFCLHCDRQRAIRTEEEIRIKDLSKFISCYTLY